MSLKVVFLILAVLGCGASSMNLEDINFEAMKSRLTKLLRLQPIKKSFQAFIKMFRKGYEPYSLEGIRRFNVFQENIQFIESSNAQNQSFKLELNEFADYTHEEFKSAVLQTRGSENILNQQSVHLQKEENSIFLSDEIEQTTEIDYTSHFNSSNQQGACGSCWAISTATVIEGNYHKKFGKYISLSPQDLIDCNQENHGCTNGDYRVALEYAQENGIAYENHYPFTSRDSGRAGSCKENLPRNFVVSDYKMGSGKKKLIEFLNLGPTVVYFDGESRFLQFYSEGDLSFECKNPNHVVVAVGYSSNSGVYKLKNSWGPRWGEKGYFRFKETNGNLCFMDKSPSIPIVTKTNVPEPPAAAARECPKFYDQCNLRGNSIITCEGLSSVGLESVSSLNMGRYMDVAETILFKNEHCLGPIVIVKKSIPCFDASNLINYKQVKSIAFDLLDEYPREGCIWAYKNTCWSGQFIEICESSKDLSSYEINSIKLSKGYIANAYSGLEFAGTSSVISSHKQGSPSQFNVKVNSIVIKKE